ncbi:MAG: molybdopterin-dependent oxidoreductase [Planctomycetes bacterium]|nr:molybdopterin-dependent oxidoreductase [Planctomycetota bacterium]
MKSAQRPTELPPGQRAVERLPVRHVGDPPPFDGSTWTLTLMGAIERPNLWSLDELLRMSTVDIEADFHAGSGWSVRRVRWRGVRLADVLSFAKPTPQARFVRFTDGVRYDTSLDLASALAPDALLATARDGAALELLHGGPLRLVVPAKYGRKSLKWLRGIEVVHDDVPGYWERRGFHAGADPWNEERLA